MNLFIETPQRAAERLERERRLGRDPFAAPGAPYASAGAAHGSAGAVSIAAASLDLDEPESAAPYQPAARPLAGNPYSVAQESYQRELAFDRRRTRKRKITAVLKTIFFILLLPVALVAVFIAAYALACIANGASPQELLQLLGALLERMGGFAAGAFAAS